MIACIIENQIGETVLEVRVTDTGIGLFATDQLFVPFSELAKQNSKQEIISNGFGLSICK